MGILAFDYLLVFIWFKNKKIDRKKKTDEVTFM